MKTFSSTRIPVLALTLILGTVLGLPILAQDATPQTDAKLTAEQKVQLERLSQLEQQLQKSREALHAAINQYGWDSDQADDAREKLVSDRAEYRKLRRSLVASGVPVPSPSGFGAGGPTNPPPAGRGTGRPYGRHHRNCDCPCMGN